MGSLRHRLQVSDRPPAESVRSRRFKLLYELGSAFASQIRLDDLIPTIMTRCRDALGAEGAAVLLLDSEAGELYFPFVSERDPEVAAKLQGHRFPANEGIAGDVISTATPQRIADVANDPRWYRRIDDRTGVTTRDMLVVPLLSTDGSIGVVEVVNSLRDGGFTEEDLSLLEALAGSIAVAIENARLFSEAELREARLRSEVLILRRDLARRGGLDELVGSSSVMGEVFRLMESAAASPISVLIEGETGTGKELVARGIHRAGARADRPFVAMNCAALPADLLESQLFGHRRGSFTGATTDHEGLFAAADGGTVFLDEVGELPVAMQVKLLRVLQDGEITPVGSNVATRVQIRVISATNRDLSAGVREGTFREDLYYRLAAFPIRVPPLRDRDGDIELLARHFLTLSADRHGKRIEGISAGALDALRSCSWPGNVRQLQNEIDRAVALTSEGGSVSRDSLLVAAGSAQSSAVTSAASAKAADGDTLEPLREARAAFEAGYIRRALEAHDGNVSRTADALGISRVMLQRKMKGYGLRDV